MRWDLHGLIIEGTTNDATLASRWQRSFSSLPTSESNPDLRCHLDLVESIPASDIGEPIYVQKHQSSYYRRKGGIQILFPDFGQLDLDYAKGETTGVVVEACLDTYGLLEDAIASGLSPHLRRKGFFMVHAFGAAKDGRFALIVGDIGTGKTTSGIALLEGGWQLISNDSPIAASGGRVLSYPGFLAAFPDSLSMFERTTDLTKGVAEDEKKEYTAERMWPKVWCAEAGDGQILFPQFRDSDDHELQPLSRAEALGRLLPHTIDSWDKSMQFSHLAVLEELVEVSPAYSLQIGRNLRSFPELISSAIESM